MATAEEEAAVVVSPVGRTGTTPVAVDEVWVTMELVERVLVEERGMQEELEAHANPSPQHPPPMPTGQAWELVEHANVVWMPVYVLVDSVVAWD